MRCISYLPYVNRRPISLTYTQSHIRLIFPHPKQKFNRGTHLTWAVCYPNVKFEKYYNIFFFSFIQTICYDCFKGIAVSYRRNILLSSYIWKMRFISRVVSSGKVFFTLMQNIIFYIFYIFKILFFGNKKSSASELEGTYAYDFSLSFIFWKNRKFWDSPEHQKVVLKNLNMLYLLYFCYTSYILVFTHIHKVYVIYGLELWFTSLKNQ